MAERPNRDQLARLERSIRRRLDVTAALRRAWYSLPAVVQIVAAVTASYAVAHFALGHGVPLLAVTVTITALGFARDARPRRLLEQVIGMLVGIALSDVITLVVGRGLWQLVVVLFVTLLIARMVSSNPAFAVAAGVQSALVVLLPAPFGGPFTRTLDAVIGCAFALLVTALVPRDPRREAVREGRTLFSVLTESTATIVDALATADSAAGELALTRLRRTQALIDTWTTSLDSALAVARIAPLLRRHLPELRVQRRLLDAADLSSRHLRVIARRVEFLVRDGVRRPELASLVSEIGTAIGLLAGEIDDRELTGSARSLLSDLARRLSPDVIPDAGVADSALLLQLRPLVVDLLAATGMPSDDARALLPPF